MEISRCFLPRLLGYHELDDSDNDGESDDTVTVLVGKEKRVFAVEQRLLEEESFRILMETEKKKERRRRGRQRQRKRKSKRKKVFFLPNVDSILFEHLIWLVHNGQCFKNSVIHLNLQEIVEFYAQD